MLKNIVLSLFLVVPYAAAAEDLLVTCKVKEQDDQGNSSSYKVRLEIDLEPRFFKQYVDNGKGFRPVRDGFPTEVDERRITMIDEGDTQEYYDRRSEEYIYRNDTTGAELKGKCSSKEIDFSEELSSI